MRRIVWVSLAMSLSVGLLAAHSQEAVPTVEKVLAQMRAYGRDYHAKLPSLTCDESITSQVVKKGQVKKSVHIESTLREVRAGNGDEFTETHAFRTADGSAIHGNPNIPFFVQGGFANAIGFAPNGGQDSSRCFDYKVSVQDEGKTLQFDVTLRPEVRDLVCKDVPEGYRKSVWIERASERVMRVERTISAEAAKKGKEVYFASLTYGPQKMGDETLWLPTEMSAHDPKDEGRMLVQYTNYHRYAATATIVPDP